MDPRLLTLRMTSCLRWCRTVMSWGSGSVCNRGGAVPQRPLDVMQAAESQSQVEPLPFAASVVFVLFHGGVACCLLYCVNYLLLKGLRAEASI